MKCFLLKKIRDAHVSSRTLSLFAIILVLFTPMVADAQNLVVKGVVTDAADAPLLGATIIVDGTTIGTTTDFDGAYTLSVPSAESVLSISYVGYQTVKEAVGGRTQINVQLDSDSEQIEEVVVVGYGVQKKESVVGAISQVDGEALVQSGTSNVTNAIAGRLSGVVTIQSSGQPGENDADILVRGVSSWNGSSPLMLVDGVERDFRDMDPNEIETFSVLKDASATAVFGAKGANGVIIVTTKRGNEGAPKLNVSASYGLSNPSVGFDHIDSYTTMSMRNEGLKNIGMYGDLLSDSTLDKYRNPQNIIDKVRYPDVDWMDLLTNDFANEVNANVSLNGGTKAVKYFVSLGYNHEGSLFKSYKTDECDTSFKNDRINYRTNLDFQLNKGSKLSFNVGGSLTFNRVPTGSGSDKLGYIWEAIYTQSTCKYPAFYPEEFLEAVPDPSYPDAEGDRLILGPETRNSPYSYLQQGMFEQTTASVLYTDLAFDQKLDFITKGLSASAKVSVNTNYRNQSLNASLKVPLYSFNFDNYDLGVNPWVMEGVTNDDVYVDPELNMNVGGMESFKLDLYYEASLRYNRSFNDHSVSGLLLFNRSQKQSGADFPYYNESWVARATYDYKHKYLLEMNVGYTGSEKFAQDRRFGFFPSLAVGYVVSNEDWFRDNVSWIDKLKLRYSDGYVGSDTGDRWLYVNEYINNPTALIYEGAIANLNAQWEESHKRDIGVELGFLDNALTLHVDLFDDQRSMMLVDPSALVTPVLGGNGFKEQNLGSMKKHGMEIEAEYRGSIKSGLQYNVRGMFGFNENRILAKVDLPNEPDYQKEANKPYGGKNKGSVTSGSGFFESIDDIHNYATKDKISLDYYSPGSYRYVDYNGDGVIDSTYDLYPVVGSQYPPVTYSFGGGLSYKNFSFNVLFQGTGGKYVQYSGAFTNEFGGDDWRVQKTMLDYWTPTNQDAFYNSISAEGYTAKNSMSGLVDRSWVKADYLKLRDVYLGYKFDTKKLNQLVGLSSLTVYATGNNLLTFTKLPYGDPESKGFSSGGYPQMKTVKLGVKLGF